MNSIQNIPILTVLEVKFYVHSFDSGMGFFEILDRFMKYKLQYL